jgi:hypothetical protein
MNVQNLARGSTFPQPNGPVRVQSGSLMHVVDGLPLRLVNELEFGRNLGEYVVFRPAWCAVWQGMEPWWSPWQAGIRIVCHIGNVDPHVMHTPT